MSAFIVSGGSLLEVGCPSSLSRSTDQQVGFRTTLGGKRKAFIRKGGRRAWSVDVSVARPGEVSTLETIARGVGPYGWYPPEAVKGNLLSPQASTFDATPTDATGMGLIQLPDGTVAAAVAHTGPGLVYPGGAEAVPVRPGVPVSVGAWASGGVQLLGVWRDAAGDSVGWSTPAQGGPGWGWCAATLTPPASAVSIVLALSAGTAYARPSISWGATARDEVGTGCPAAVIHSPSHTPVALWEGANYTDTAYSVVEVG